MNYIDTITKNIQMNRIHLLTRTYNINLIRLDCKIFGNNNELDYEVSMIGEYCQKLEYIQHFIIYLDRNYFDKRFLEFMFTNLKA